MQSVVPLPKVDPSTPGYAKLHQQAKDLEGVFLNTLMKEMFSSVKTDDQNFGGGFAEETWRGMQAEQFSSAMPQPDAGQAEHDREEDIGTGVEPLAVLY